MLLSAIDPALLIYQQEHWQTRQPHFFSRIKALTLHRRMIKEYNQQIGISNEIVALVLECFPWETRSLSEKQCSKRYTSLVEYKDANYSTTKSRLL